ncbi:phosphomannomutase [Thiomicrorhabdus aquaedulcis]|uniref:phosphomannomutase n=1 Tax=Thiomicrorhabdus aquaedulcis TaxID=2211106 RepID=UPI000FD6F241|nr:phosphomannomutase [Thiomicrorhabdus aquaedulcis]
MTQDLSCFKAYDIRGQVPAQLNATLAYQIGRAFATQLHPANVVVGYDIRLESLELANALMQGLVDSGVDVINIGLCGTEEVYFGTAHLAASGGIMVTASHNPKGYNGMKLVAADARPVSGDSGLNEMKACIANQQFAPLKSAEHVGVISLNPCKNAYINHLLTYVDQACLKPFNLVVNAGNGAAGPTFDALASHLPFKVTTLHHAPDGDFPHGVPNPMLIENRAITAQTVVAQHADMGIAWDGDFDRCFLFDENGEFIEGYYLVGLLAETLLAKHPGGKIVHDPRLTWNTIEQVEQAGGVPIQSKTGHAFIKERMRKEDAVYGGEMSAHHYFKTFWYCDSGMIPWLLIAQLMSTTGKKLSELVAQRMAAYPCSGEINYTVKDSAAILARVRAHFAPQNPHLDQTDGLSLEFSEWRMNIRSSNTEPLLRLNIEARGNPELVWQKVAEIEDLINA